MTPWQLCCGRRQVLAALLRLSNPSPPLQVLRDCRLGTGLAWSLVWADLHFPSPDSSQNSEACFGLLPCWRIHYFPTFCNRDGKACIWDGLSLKVTITATLDHDTVSSVDTTQTLSASYKYISATPCGPREWLTLLLKYTNKDGLHFFCPGYHICDGVWILLLLLVELACLPCVSSM